MRTSTFLVSFLVHTLVIGAAAAARILATGELPEPPRATTFIIVTPEVPAIDPPPAVRRREAQPAAVAAPIPIAEPDGITAEVPAPQVFDLPVGDGLVDGSIARDGAIDGADLVAPPPAATAPQPVQPFRVGGDIRPPVKVHHVAPVYPSIARSAGVSGVVILEAVIDGGGSVQDVRVLRSVPLLDAAALEAVRQWRFTPTLLNGQPIPVVMTVTVSFALN